MKKKYIILLLIFITIIFFHQIIFQNKIAITGDFISMSMPWKTFLFNNIKNGGLPYRNPYVFSGLPFISNIQAGLFYPPDIFFYFVPPLIAFKITYFINYLILIFGSYLLINFIFKDKNINLFGIIAISFSWFFIYYSPLKQVQNVVVWIPLIFYLGLKFVTTFHYSLFFYLTIALSCQIVGGHIQFTFFTILFLICLIFLFLTFTSKKLFFGLCFLTIILISAIFLSSIQLFPTIEFSLNSARKLTSNYNFATIDSLKPIKFLTAFVPNLFGNIADKNQIGSFWRPLKTIHTHTEFLGLLPLILLFFSFSFFKSKDTFYKSIYYTSFILTILSILIALGKYTFFYKIFISILPVVSIFRAPHRILVFYIIFTTILAAFGLKNLLNEEETAKNHKILSNFIFFYIIIFSIFLVILFFKQPLEKIITKQLWYRYNLKTTHYNSWEYYITTFNNYSKFVFKNIMIFFYFFLLYLITIFLTLKKKKFFFLIILIYIADLYLFNSKFLFVSDINNLFNTKQKSAFNFKDSRYLPLLPLDHPLNRNTNMMFNLKSIKGYDPLVDKNYISFISKVETQKKKTFPNTILEYPKLDSNQLALLNCKYIISDTPIKMTSNIKFSKKIFFTPNNLYLYENKKVFGNFKFYTDYIQEPNLNKSLKLINKINIKKTILINSNKKFNKTSNFNSIYKFNITKYKINEINLEGVNSSSGFLFLSEKYDKHWTVYDNNKKIPNYKVFNLFTGIYLKPGIHKIKLIYEYTSLYWGAIVSIITLCILILFSFTIKKIVHFLE